MMRSKKRHPRRILQELHLAPMGEENGQLEIANPVPVALAGASYPILGLVGQPPLWVRYLLQAIHQTGQGQEDKAEKETGRDGDLP